MDGSKKETEAEFKLSQTVPANFDLINLAIQETEKEFLKKYGDLSRTAKILVWQDGDFSIEVLSGDIETQYRRKTWYQRGKITHWEGRQKYDF